MVSEAPPFWWQDPDWRAWSLYPFSRLYGAIAARRMNRARREPVSVPVICVGNFTAGGAGKTPTALALADAAHDAGLVPGFLSRGHGGAIRAATVVDPTNHHAGDVGDEPLLLAEKAITVIGLDRIAGASLLASKGVDLIIMDDGFQSARIGFDYALVVIDAARGLGNGHVIPGGPVRAPLRDQLRHATALLKIGDDTVADPLIRMAARAAKPVYRAHLVPCDTSGIAGRRVGAFAGIGDPGKFRRTLEAAGAEVLDFRGFGDHHHFSDDEIAEILRVADKEDLILVTTAKDAARLRHGHGRAAELLERTAVLKIDLVFDDPGLARQIVDAATENFRRRRIGR